MPMRSISTSLPVTQIQDSPSPLSEGMLNAASTLWALGPKMAEIKLEKQRYADENNRFGAEHGVGDGTGGLWDRIATATKQQRASELDYRNRSLDAMSQYRQGMLGTKEDALANARNIASMKAQTQGQVESGRNSRFEAQHGVAATDADPAMAATAQAAGAQLAADTARKGQVAQAQIGSSQASVAGHNADIALRNLQAQKLQSQHPNHFTPYKADAAGVMTSTDQATGDLYRVGPDGQPSVIHAPAQPPALWGAPQGMPNASAPVAPAGPAAAPAPGAGAAPVGQRAPAPLWNGPTPDAADAPAIQAAADPQAAAFSKASGYTPKNPNESAALLGGPSPDRDAVIRAMPQDQKLKVIQALTTLGHQ